MGLFRRGQRDGRSAPRAVGSKEHGVVLAEAKRLVLPGFSTLDEARSAIAELVEDDDELGVTAEQAVAVVNSVWARRVSEQQSWRGLSDADRVAAAFNELEAAGVVARMCFTCCQTCGAAEIGDEVPSGATPRGYVFFHGQDADRLAEPNAPLYLSYGAFSAEELSSEEYELAAVEIGHLVKRTLEANGLRVRWDGALDKRIHVVKLDWRRPLPA